MLNFHFADFAKNMGAIGLAAIAVGTVGSSAAIAGTQISNDMSKCSGKNGPAVLITLTGLTTSSGNVRVQSYPATKSAWLEKGRWLNRIEQRASTGTMQFCMPVPKAGNYAIAVRHDKNRNGKTDLTGDGGGFSGNPKVSVTRAIFGKSVVPVDKSSFYAGSGVTRISILLRYR